MLRDTAAATWVDLSCGDAFGSVRGVTLLPLFVVLGAAVGVGVGGSLQSLAETKFRYVPVLVGALAIQLVFLFGHGDFLGNAAVWVFVAAQLGVAAFLFFNHNLPGMKLAAIGFLINVIVIVANGAMPVSASAAAAVHDERPPPAGSGYKHERLNDGTVLPWLADVIPVRVINVVISPGDVVIALGIGWLVYARTRVGSTRGRHARARSGGGKHSLR
jgi:hypothetical protein